MRMKWRTYSAHPEHCGASQKKTDSIACSLDRRQSLSRRECGAACMNPVSLYPNSQTYYDTITESTLIPFHRGMGYNTVFFPHRSCPKGKNLSLFEGWFFRCYIHRHRGVDPQSTALYPWIWYDPWTSESVAGVFLDTYLSRILWSETILSERTICMYGTNPPSDFFWKKNRRILPWTDRLAYEAPAYSRFLWESGISCHFRDDHTRVGSLSESRMDRRSRNVKSRDEISISRTKYLNACRRRMIHSRSRMALSRKCGASDNENWYCHHSMKCYDSCRTHILRCITIETRHTYSPTRHHSTSLFCSEPSVWKCESIWKTRAYYTRTETYTPTSISYSNIAQFLTWKRRLCIMRIRSQYLPYTNTIHGRWFYVHALEILLFSLLLFFLVLSTGIEPVSEPSEGPILPLNYESVREL